MDDSKRPGKRADPKKDDPTKSLVADFLASTRAPIGSGDLFTDPFDAPPTQAPKPRDSKMGFSDPGRDPSGVMAIYLIAFIGAIVAVALFLLR